MTPTPDPATPREPAAPPEPASGADPASGAAPAAAPVRFAFRNPTPLEGPPRVPRAAELGTVLVAVVYLVFAPRKLLIDFAVLTGSCGLLLWIWDWRLPAALLPRAEVRQRAGSALLLGTIALSIGMGLFAWVREVRFGLLTLALTFLVYVPYAWMQQLLAQGYVVNRIARLPAGRDRPVLAAALGSLLFAVCHWPFPHLVLPSLAFGFLWSLAFRFTGQLRGVVLSHAALSALFFLCVLEGKPFRALGIGG